MDIQLKKSVENPLKIPLGVRPTRESKRATERRWSERRRTFRWNFEREKKVVETTSRGRPARVFVRTRAVLGRRAHPPDVRISTRVGERERERERERESARAREDSRSRETLRSVFGDDLKTLCQIPAVGPARFRVGSRASRDRPRAKTPRRRPRNGPFFFNHPRRERRYDAVMVKGPAAASNGFWFGMPR